jgi:signal transduction histidine kinase
MAQWRRFLGCLFGAREDPGDQDHVQNDPNLVEFYFEVVDTGIGIPKEKRISLFENYVQVNNGHCGTGLGLGVVQSFVSCYSNVLYTYMYLLYSFSL